MRVVVGVAVLALVAGCRLNFENVDDASISVQNDGPISADAVYGTYGGTGSQIVRGIDVDRSQGGIVAVVGAFEGSVTLGSGLASIGNYDAYVLALSGDGRLLWARSFGSTGSDVALHAAVDNGEIVVTGYFSGPTDFGTGLITPLGEEDIFVARLDTTGTTRWVRTFGDTVTGSPYGSDRGEQIAVVDGVTYLAGQFAGTVDFGNGAMTMTATGDDVFIAGLDEQGTVLWAHHYGDNVFNKVAGITANSDGVVISGYYQGTPSFGGTALQFHGGNDLYVAAYSPQGTHRWSISAGGLNNEFGRGVALDAAGNVYVSGYYGGTMNFGSGPQTPMGALDAFVASYSPTGTYRWSHTMQATCGRGEGIEVSGDRVYAAGSFDGMLTSPMLQSVGQGEAYIVAFDLDGNVTGQLPYGQSDYDSGYSLGVLANGDLLFGGDTGGSSECTTAPTRGPEDLFLLRIPAP